jgi:hypothetical protein
MAITPLLFILVFYIIAKAYIKNMINKKNRENNCKKKRLKIRKILHNEKYGFGEIVVFKPSMNRD